MLVCPFRVTSIADHLNVGFALIHKEVNLSNFLLQGFRTLKYFHSNLILVKSPSNLLFYTIELSRLDYSFVSYESQPLQTSHLFLFPTPSQSEKWIFTAKISFFLMGWSLHLNDTLIFCILMLISEKLLMKWLAWFLWETLKTAQQFLSMIWLTLVGHSH